MKTKFLFITIIVVALLAGITSVAIAGSELIIPLNNDTAKTGTDCPADGLAYWHFVISPNNNQSAFIQFHLNLGNGNYYDTTVFVTNGSQWDNVFVQVPSGYLYTSLVKDGSTAAIVWSGVGTEPEKFQLSHICPGLPPQDLTISKTATTSFKRTFDWIIDKTADKTRVYSAGGGESEPVNYTVTVTKDAGTDSDWAVSGTITVYNPNVFAVSGVNITDGVCPVAGGANITIPAKASVTVSYVCALDGAVNGTNVATVTWLPIGSPSTSATASADYVFGAPTTIINDGVDVKDTNGTEWHFTASGSESYQMTFTDPAGTCTSHENTATILQLDKSASVMVEDCQGADLKVSKTVIPSFDLTYEWDIAKDVDLTYIKVDPGQPVVFNYTVVVSHDFGTESNWQVNGEITVSNPNDWQSIVATITDVIPDGSCSVIGGVDVVIPPSGYVTRPYVCNFAANPGSGTNTATATWDAALYYTPNGSALGTADFVFDVPTNVYDECIEVDDSLYGFLGTVCVGDYNPYEFNYSMTFYGPTGGTCVDKNNVATFYTNDYYLSKSDDETVTVCSWKARLTPGYWKNHLLFDPKNPSNPYVFAYLPQKLGTFPVTTTQIATSIWDLMNCSNTGTTAKQNQNALGCLAGHLLAAKLNVVNGANQCIQPTIAAADAFLSSIPYVGPSGNYSLLSTANRNTAISLKNLLDAYNNGNGCH